MQWVIRHLRCIRSHLLLHYLFIMLYFILHMILLCELVSILFFFCIISLTMVVLKHTLRFKFLVTLLTEVNSVSQVPFLMINSIAIGYKSFGANCTSIWSFSSVSPHMIDPARFVFESFLAVFVGACVYFLPVWLVSCLLLFLMNQIVLFTAIFVQWVFFQFCEVLVKCVLF